LKLFRVVNEAPSKHKLWLQLTYTFLKFQIVLISILSGRAEAQEVKRPRLNPYSYAANQAQMTEFTELLKQGEGLRRDFAENTNPTDAHGIEGLVTPDKFRQKTLPLLKVFFRGASVAPVYAKNGYYIIFYNPVADVSLITSWKRDNSAVSLLQARIIVGETLYASVPAKEQPSWIEDDQFAARMRANMTTISKMAAQPDSELFKRLERWLSTPADTVEAAKAFHRIAVATKGLFSSVVPCADSMSGLKTLPQLERAAARTNMQGDIGERSIVRTGGMTTGGLSIQFFTLADYTDVVFIAVADEHKKCELLSVTAIEPEN
jgi:hypothetical protein